VLESPVRAEYRIKELSESQFQELHKPLEPEPS